MIGAQGHGPIACVRGVRDRGRARQLRQGGRCARHLPGQRDALRQRARSAPAHAADQPHFAPAVAHRRRRGPVRPGEVDPRGGGRDRGTRDHRVAAAARAPAPQCAAELRQPRAGAAVAEVHGEVPRRRARHRPHRSRGRHRRGGLRPGHPHLADHVGQSHRAPPGPLAEPRVRLARLPREARHARGARGPVTAPVPGLHLRRDL